MIDSMILGERLRLIRKQLGITQKQLAKVTNLTQAVISRLENGEEVYASALLTILHYYHGKVSLDNLFATYFSAEEERLRYLNEEEARQKLIHQLDVIIDTISTANETSLSQIALMKKIIQRTVGAF